MSTSPKLPTPTAQLITVPIPNIPLTMQITQCLHTAILVSDLQKAEYFYGTVLRLPQVERSLKFPGIWYQIGNYQLHIMVAPQPTTGLQNPDKWGRNAHIAFSVADLDAAKQQLLQHNCPIQASSSGRPAIFTQDPDGNIIELGQLSMNNDQ